MRKLFEGILKLGTRIAIENRFYYTSNYDPYSTEFHFTLHLTLNSTPRYLTISSNRQAEWEERWSDLFHLVDNTFSDSYPISFLLHGASVAINDSQNEGCGKRLRLFHLCPDKRLECNSIRHNLRDTLAH